ncbi:hypothetical protein CR513_42265, partial [Mucuna pruriens]
MVTDERENLVQPAIRRFDDHYDHWSMLMENFLLSKEYREIVETGIAEPAAGVILNEARQRKFEETKLKDLKVKNYLLQAIDRIILETILKTDTSKDMGFDLKTFSLIKKKYEGNTRVKRLILQALRKDFGTLETKSGESVIEYFSRVMSVANKMRAYGEELKDVAVVEKILRNLKNINELSIVELQSSLVKHKQKFHEPTNEEQELKVKHEERYDGSGRGRGRNSSRGERGRGRGCQPYNKAICHQLGHYQYECPTWDKQANYAALDEIEKILLMSYEEMQEANQSDAWFIDSGCNNHMCVTRVFYVPKSKNNLSMDQLQGRGLVILIQFDK